MRFILIFVAVAAMAFGGWWVLGSRAVDDRLAEITAQLRSEGWQVDYDTDGTGGFPYRFDTELRDIALATPDASFGWQTPSLRVLAQSYQPNRLIALAAPGQTVTLPDQQLDLVAEDLRASAGVGLSQDLPLSDLTVESGAARIVSSQGWELALTRLVAALRATETATDAGTGYDLYALAEDIAPSAELLARYDANGVLPERIGTLSIDAGIMTDRPLGLQAAGTPLLQSLALRGLTLDWGPVALTGSGDLTADAEGRAEGSITLQVTGWQLLVDLAVSSGALPSGQAMLLRGVLQSMTDDGDVLEAPISFDGGRMSLGFVPLGAAPLLR